MRFRMAILNQGLPYHAFISACVSVLFYRRQSCLLSFTICCSSVSNVCRCFCNVQLECQHVNVKPWLDVKYKLFLNNFDIILEFFYV